MVVRKESEPLLKPGLISAPLVAANHTLPVGSLVPHCAAAEKHPAGDRLLDHLLRRQSVDDAEDLIGTSSEPHRNCTVGIVYLP
jgi:hypothetical protein